MKKILIRLAIVLVLLVIVAVVAVGLSLNSAIKKGVETVGPRITKVPVKLEGVSLSLFSGSGGIKGLIIGNPEGYKTEQAMSVGLASISVSPGSIFSDKIVVKSIQIEAPKITIEIGPGGSNLQVIQNNLSSGSTESSPAPTTDTPATESKSAKKLQVDQVLVRGGSITLGAAALGGKIIEAPLPEISLSGLGQGPEGITAAELGKVVLSKINEAAMKTYGDKLAEAGAEALKNVTQNATNAVNKATSDVLNKATKGLDNLLNKKKE